MKEMHNSSRPMLSVIMPTFNSEETLELTLKSLHMQTFPTEQMEILVIDGGSTDKTQEIANKFNVKFIEFPGSLIAHAAELGFKHASGQYILRMDSDESFINEYQLERRFTFLDKNPNVKCMGTNRFLSPRFDKKNFSRSYMNIYGEPFSAFVYKKKEIVIDTFRKNIIKQDEDGSYILGFKKNETYPILDAGATLFSHDYVNEHFSEEMKNIDFVLQASEQVMLKTGVVGFIDGDDILHLTKTSFNGYLKKIKYRIINNIYDTKTSGYTNVAKHVPVLNRRKYLFVLYALTLICPIVHSIYYSIKHKDAALLAHFIYTLYTITMIAYYLCRKLLRLPAKNTNYG